MSTVLIVDDGTNLRRLLRDTLEGEGHTLLQAATGEEAKDPSVFQSGTASVLKGGSSAGAASSPGGPTTASAARKRLTNDQTLA